MAADLARAPTAGHRRAASRPVPAGQAPERAQLVWRRALALTGPPAQQDRFALALDLLRAAHRSRATIVHALTLGTSHPHTHPDDALAREGVTMLEPAIAFLGVKPRTGEITVARR